VVASQLEIQVHAAAIRIQAAYRGSRERRMVEQALEEQLQPDELIERNKKKQQQQR
jgi:hypothetical protein